MSRWEIISSVLKLSMFLLFQFYYFNTISTISIFCLYEHTYISICIFCEWIWGLSVRITHDFHWEGIHLKSDDEVILNKRVQLKCRYYRHQTLGSVEFKTGTWTVLKQEMPLQCMKSLQFTNNQVQMDWRRCQYSTIAFPL